MRNGDELRGAALGLAHGPLYRVNGHAKRAMDVGNPPINGLGFRFDGVATEATGGC